jgi:uncharacterized membrane protein
METIYLITLVLRWCHILGAIGLMGGAIFMRLALLPAAAELDEAAHARLRAGLRARWSRWVMIGSALLLVSGIANVGLNESRLSFDQPTTYRILLAIKIMLALPVLHIAMTLVGRSSLAERMRANARFWLTVNLLLATTIVGLGGAMRFFDRRPKPPRTTEAAASLPGDSLPSKSPATAP